MKARRNPITTKAGRRLTPENCPSHLAASLVAEQHRAKALGLPVPHRFGNCTLESAEYALAHHKPGSRPGGKNFSGTVRRGHYPDADWTVQLSGGQIMSYWRKKLAEPAPSGFAKLFRLIPWWPTNAEARENPTRDLLKMVAQRPGRRVLFYVGESLPMERELSRLKSQGLIELYNDTTTQPLSGPRVRLTKKGVAMT